MFTTSISVCVRRRETITYWGEVSEEKAEEEEKQREVLKCEPLIKFDI